MKLLRYGALGAEKPGLLDAEGKIRDLSDVVADIAGEALSDAALDKIKALDTASLPVVSGTPRCGACVGQVGKFVCIGLNYADHAAESGLVLPKEPVVFFKATSAICGANDDVEIPRDSVKTDWELNWVWSLAKIQNTYLRKMRSSMLLAIAWLMMLANAISNSIVRGNGSKANLATRSARLVRGW